jgi:hypothetical protein
MSLGTPALKGPAMSTSAKKREPDYVKLAIEHVPLVDRVEGTGPYAFITACRAGFVYVSLWETQEEAEQKKASIDRFGCGGRCRSEMRHLWHRIFDIRETAVSWPPADHGNPPRFAHGADKPITQNEGGSLKTITAEEWFEQHKHLLKQP